MTYFEWDPAKAAYNLEAHGIAFDDASLVFDDPYRLTEEDSVVDSERRWRTIGSAFGIVVLLVIHLEEEWNHDLFVRIISARKATPLERLAYDQNRQQDSR